jgi:hypothetical protein
MISTDSLPEVNKVRIKGVGDWSDVSTHVIKNEKKMIREREILLGRSKCRQEENIKTDLK